MISKIDLAAAHIRQCLAQTTKRPLFVGLQGPQGSGKSYLCARLPEALAPIRAAVLSIDDLYLPHADLVRVAREHPSNKLLAGRGQPGTHDVELGVRTFEALSKADGEASLPVFDKSLHGGEGDRVKSIEVQLPLDVVVVEGWCMGFYPLSNEALEAVNAPTEVREINEFLKEYASKWYPIFSAFIQITPDPPGQYDLVYKWRLEQEHHMKSRNGGVGMSDDQVKGFVDRYIPGYVFFGRGVQDGGDGVSRHFTKLHVADSF
ncbi:P-loop containing nucleoside triphosphate hydrolase protein [Exidia glandulosa HHB12029]|uniref:p-loop containing nucleoside triphosphate hydrolase protein n=1 Tax=Exidia glandulosa HHB12029 TaxID=1314781 RepID=A0A165CUA4_EXIGL|nr:P-loop containing nucleoside triphosphate hydrolase protein [Exidia glandulosa HHB12029]